MLMDQNNISWTRTFFAYLITSLAAGLWGGVLGVCILVGFDNIFLRILMGGMAIMTGWVVWPLIYKEE